MKRWVRWAVIALLALGILGGVGFYLWATSAAPPQPVALSAAAEATTRTSDNWLVFGSDEAEVGLIFYPGGRVDARAYAPAAQAIAQNGFLVVIVPMPLNLAFTDINAADRVRAAFPSVDHWAIGGHSLGGAMAAQYAYDHPGAVDGLVLWAAYPAESASLADRTDLIVVSVYASGDGLATPAEIEASRALLPLQTSYAEIEGGNHAGFGYYGPQSGDGEASISVDAQQTQTIAATLTLLFYLQNTAK